jgi:Flp pilus assembly protein TadG
VLADSTRRAGGRDAEGGAVAVEFALLLPLLMMFLFGIIQYGYGLFQLQALTSTVSEATQKATTGITSGVGFEYTLQSVIAGNGLDLESVTSVQVDWLTEGGDASPVPDPLGLVTVTVSFVPFDLGIPFVPFPDTITRSQTGSMQNVVSVDLPGCDLAF